jgi:hypothetical protein
MMKLGNSGQRTDILGIGSDRLFYHLHFTIVALESFIVVVLAGGHFLQALGHLLEDAFYTVKPFIAISHHSASLSDYHQVAGRLRTSVNEGMLGSLVSVRINGEGRAK